MMPGKVNSEQLKFWLDNNQAILVDVREPWENQNVRIEGAVLIPLNVIALNKLPKLDGRKLVIHCRSGMRSEIACNQLMDDDPNLEVYNLEGGIESWMSKGYEVLRSSN